MCIHQVACQHLLSLPVDVHGRALPKRPKDLSQDIQQLALQLLEQSAVRHYEIMSMDLIGNALTVLADLNTLFRDKRYCWHVCVLGFDISVIKIYYASTTIKRF